MPRKPSRKAAGALGMKRKKVVRDFFRLVMEGRQKEGLRFFSPSCKQHNPYVLGGMDALFDAMTAAQQQGRSHPDPLFKVKKVLCDGDTVAAHTELIVSRSDLGAGGLRQVHLFRFGRDGKVAEYWDVTQTISADMPNAASAF